MWNKVWITREEEKGTEVILGRAGRVDLIEKLLP